MNPLPPNKPWLRCSHVQLWNPRKLVSSFYWRHLSHDESLLNRIFPGKVSKSQYSATLPLYFRLFESTISFAYHYVFLICVGYVVTKVTRKNHFDMLCTLFWGARVIFLIRGRFSWKRTTTDIRFNSHFSTTFFYFSCFHETNLCWLLLPISSIVVNYQPFASPLSIQELAGTLFM